MIEPLAWPGNPRQPFDTLLRGKYLYEVIDSDTGELLFSRSFSSIYGEWETTAEARRIKRTFHESVRFPRPENPFRLVIRKRDSSQEYRRVWQIDLDPDDYMNHHEAAAWQSQVVAIEQNGNPADKVDLLLLGDGYTADEQGKFIETARKLTEAFFATSPFDRRRQDFNVWALAPVSAESGISRPSTDTYRDSPLGTRYDAFRSERYVLTYDNKAWRRVAASVPYDAVEILVNNETYGGGGIYGLYSTAAANNDWADYLFIHEFGHHFAGLADEYYTSSVAYEAPANITEPYEPNVTALLDPDNLKWKHLVDSDTTLPTAWPKEAFETHSHAYQEKRRQLRADRRPESEMSTLFTENQEHVEGLFSAHENHQLIGAFEGANYQASGYYRSSMNCIMFTRTKDFCTVCGAAIEDMIDLLTR